jgi:single-strand DNA-binding protein
MEGMKFFRSPLESTRLVWEQPPLLPGAQATGQKEGMNNMNLNQLTIIGFVGKKAETKHLPNGTPVIKFSAATKKSWKDENQQWKDKTQWHDVVAYGTGFAQMAERLVKGAHVFVQGELNTRQYDRTIKVPNGKKVIEHVIRQLVVELRADSIRILDRSNSNGAQSDATEPPSDEQTPE